MGDAQNSVLLRLTCPAAQTRHQQLNLLRIVRSSRTTLGVAPSQTPAAKRIATARCRTSESRRIARQTVVANLPEALHCPLSGSPTECASTERVPTLRGNAHLLSKIRSLAEVVPHAIAVEAASSTDHAATETTHPTATTEADATARHGISTKNASACGEPASSTRCAESCCKRVVCTSNC